jgi:hypothetical protein
MSALPGPPPPHYDFINHQHIRPGTVVEAQKKMPGKGISEEAPLLDRTTVRVTELPEIETVRDEIEDYKQKVYKAEFLKTLKISGPVIFAYMLQNSLQTGSILVVGRLV